MRIFNYQGKEKTLRDVFILLIVLVFAVSAFLAYRKVFPGKDYSYKDNLTYIKPVTLDKIPEVFEGWPIELENILSKFYVDPQKPIDKEYVMVYKSSKSKSEVLDAYRQFFANQKIRFVARSLSQGASSVFAILKSENSQAEVNINGDEDTRVTLRYYTYIPGFTVPEQPPVFTPTPVPTKMVKISKVALPTFLPKGFSLFPQAEIVESYNLIDIRTEKIKQTTVVLKSTVVPEEVRAFYANSLKLPTFRVEENSPIQKDTETRKTLIFSEKTGVLTIYIIKENADVKTTIEIHRDILVP